MPDPHSYLRSLALDVDLFHLEAFVAVDNLAASGYVVLNTSVDHIETWAATNIIRSTGLVRRINDVMARSCLDEIRGSGRIGSLLPVTISCNEIIVALTAWQHIRTGFTYDKVIARPGLKLIVAPQAVEVVVSTKTHNPILGVGPEQDLRVLGASELVVEAGFIWTGGEALGERRVAASATISAPVIAIRNNRLIMY